MKNLTLLCLLLVVTGCHSINTGAKLYDNVVVVIKDDAAIVTTRGDNKDLLRVVGARLDEYTREQITAQGDMQVSSQCGAKTLKVVQDILSVDESTAVNLGRKQQHADFSMTVNTVIEDCGTGKQVSRKEYATHGQALPYVIKSFAIWNIADAYRHQRAP